MTVEILRDSQPPALAEISQLPSELTAILAQLQAVTQALATSLPGDALPVHISGCDEREDGRIYLMSLAAPTSRYSASPLTLQTLSAPLSS